ncbi:MAG: hypothetical protein K9K32_06515 [Halanaerobiales bacterium]|nr:hypothetical protein [Halanaerobiales bacterium]
MDSKNLINLIKRFEKSYKQLSKLEKELLLLNNTLESVDNQTKSIQELKTLINETSIVEELKSANDNAETILNKIKKHLTNVDRNLADINELSNNYHSNVKNSTNILNDTKQQIKKYNNEIYPKISEIGDSLDKIENVNIENLSQLIKEDLSEINNKLKTISDYSKNKNEKINDIFSKIEYNREEDINRINSFMKKNRNIYKAVHNLEDDTQNSLQKFKDLCDLWAEENIRRSSLKNKFSIKRFAFRTIIILIVIISLLFNFDQWFNNNKWSETIKFKITEIVENN